MCLNSRWDVLSDVVGQTQAVTILRRVVQGNVVSPLLLVGEEGVGRRFSVLETAREMIAAKKGADSSESVQLTHGVHPDVTVVTAPSDKEIGVEAIRDVVDQSMSYPTASPHKFFVIDGADRMTPAAANAILKTLEEPPARSLFFLLAESYDRVIPTIRSRCGRVSFRKLPENFIVERLLKYESNPDKALVYARMSEGSIGKAARFWGANRIALRDHSLNAIQAGVTGDLAGACSSIDAMGKELSIALKFLIFVAHDLLILPVDQQRAVNQDILDDLRAMRVKAKSMVVWARLWSNLKDVWARNESGYVNLGFHVKSALVAAFCE